MDAPTLYDMARCAEREVRMRLKVYPIRVAQEKMDPLVAERELRTMQAIAEYLKKVEQQDLFENTPLN